MVSIDDESGDRIKSLGCGSVSTTGAVVSISTKSGSTGGKVVAIGSEYFDIIASISRGGSNPVVSIGAVVGGCNTISTGFGKNGGKPKFNGFASPTGVVVSIGDDSSDDESKDEDSSDDDEVASIDSVEFNGS